MFVLKPGTWGTRPEEKVELKGTDSGDCVFSHSFLGSLWPKLFVVKPKRTLGFIFNILLSFPYTIIHRKKMKQAKNKTKHKNETPKPNKPSLEFQTYSPSLPSIPLSQ